jgi:hypothetical protein
MLKGAIRCPQCDVPMHKNASPNTRTSGGGTSKPYYRCRGQGPGQRGCGNNVGMEAVNRTVDQIIPAYFHVPITLRALIRGTDYQAELDQIALELMQLPGRELPRAVEQAERERLWAEEDRLKALPVEDDRWELIPTADFYDEVYAALPEHERGEWLVDNEFVVYASKAGVDVILRDLAPVSVPLER